jgi:tetratricopeptide (TPR) repeat protein
MPKRTVFLVFLASMLALRVAAALAQESTLGSVNFPTSGSPQAQAHFLRGVAALHSFWYPVALEEFRAATRAEPEFMMGYWGEAMAHNHPLWGDPQETKAARQALTHITITPQVTPRERAYIQAVQVLYGEGDKPARDQAYATAMEHIYQTYPDDLEAAALYALALLGTVRPDDPTALRTRMQAAAIALAVYHKVPNHPGAAHYILHAFDDPDHAILALPAARRYADIAPAAPHALHMPSHIFLQLGMWPEAAASNEASWHASTQWVQNHHLPVSERDYHSLHWWLYTVLQQGRYQQADGLLTLMRQSLPAFPADDQRMRTYGAYINASMAAAFVVETERWGAAAQLLASLPTPEGTTPAPSGTNPYQAFAALTQTPALFARGLAAAMQGVATAPQSTDALRAMRGQLPGTGEVFGMPMGTILEIQAFEIAAAASAAQGHLDDAIATMQQATALEEKMPPPPGPPPVIKPAHELFGEILLRAERPAEAAPQFAMALYRHPNRARALLGAARTADRRGDRAGAVSAYTQFLQQWQQSDAPLPELREVREYLQQAGVQLTTRSEK